jgi:hypothetical protein
MSSGNSKNRPGSTQSAGASGKPGPSDAPGPKGNPADAKKSGRVQFDARGNAVWEWSVATGAFGREISTERMKKLEIDALSLEEDSPGPLGRVQSNPLGTVKGYNPYDSGKLGQAQQAPKKTDLRKLGDWLKLKKQAASNKDEE